MSIVISVLYYLITLFFLLLIIRNFVKTKKPQEAIIYAVMMIPFILRITRLK